MDVAAISGKTITEGNIGVAYTYNEPLIAYEFVEDCARLITKQGQNEIPAAVRHNKS